MEPKYLKLLKKLLHGQGNDAKKICEEIQNTKLEIKRFSPALIEILALYYADIANDYCCERSEYNKSRLEKIISEIESLIF